MTLSHEMRNRFFDNLCNDKDLMWMGQNTNHFEPHPSVLAAVKESLDSGEYHIYAPPLGLEQLRHLIIADMGLPNGSAMVTNGAVEGLYNVCTRFNEPGKDFITTDPSWAWPVNFARKSGANIVRLPIYGKEHNYRLDMDQLTAPVSENTAMIYIVDSNKHIETSQPERSEERRVWKPGIKQKNIRG